MERLTDSLLNGKFLHCRPVEGGPVIKANVISLDELETPTFRVGIACPAREPASKCNVRLVAKDGDGFCHYYKGDSRGVYQIIGPGMGEKSERDNQQTTTRL